MSTTDHASMQKIIVINKKYSYTEREESPADRAAKFLVLLHFNGIHTYF